VVLAGDYNVVPTDDDIYNPRSWLRDALLQPESRACYQRLLAQGWLDTLRARHPGERIYTFWDYFRDHWKRNAGLRIDHLLLNAELAPALVDAGVHTWVRDRPRASDHAPTWITLDLDAGKPATRPKRGGGPAASRAKAAPEAKAAPTVKAKPARKPRAKTDPKAKPAPKPRAKPAPKPRARPAPKPRPKPRARPGPRSTR
jgi:exodeoxyribonuclease-3